MTRAVQARLQAYAERALPEWPAPVVGPFGRLTDGWETELYTFDVKHGPAGGRQRLSLVLRLYPGDGAERMGMRPEAVALMRAQLAAVAAVRDLLVARAGPPVPEVEALLR